MKQKRCLFILTAIFFITQLSMAQLKYPDTKKSNQTDDYFGTKVPDPYRWLEDDNSEETKAWVKEENKVTADYLATIPFRDKVHSRLEEMWNYPKYSSPLVPSDLEIIKNRSSSVSPPPMVRRG